MIITQSAFDKWAIEDESVQLICTSPPYYSLRKYAIPDIIIGGDRDCKHEWGNKNITLKHKRGETNPGKESYFEEAGASEDSGNQFCLHCQAWKGQFGLEPDYKMYIEHTRLWAKEAWRVLRKDGVMFLNLADSYAGSGGAGGDYNKGGLREGQEKYKQNKINYPSKCQLLIPHRVAIALVDDGWILRNTIVWHKPNTMPESATDRFSKKYEYIFMFVKQGDYYFDLDAVKEPTLTKDTIIRNRDIGKLNNVPGRAKMGGLKTNNYNSKKPGNVWNDIPTQPSSEKHYAMWPERLVERMILCSTKAGDTVLDPFCGSCTTLKVAKELHRNAKGIDLGYQDIAARRLSRIQKRLL